MSISQPSSLQPQVSVIILNWNGTELLRRYLPSVIACTNPELAEVIVADNGSTDESLEVLASEFPQVRVLPFDRNYGFAEGYNRAIAAVDTPYVVLLNDDVEVTPAWLEPLLGYMNENLHVAALQPKLLSDRDRTLFEYAGAAGGYLDCLGYPYCRGRIFSDVEQDNGQYDTVTPVMWATGACLMVRRDLYLQSKGLDARFFAHMEEIDLCWRLRRMGYTIVCHPASVVYHLGGASLAMGHPRKTKLNFRNSLLMLWKNVAPQRRSSVLFKRYCLDFVAALNFLLHGEWAHIRAIWDAHREARQMIRDEYEPESAEYAAYGEAAPFAEEQISILAAYYLKRQKKFSQLVFPK